MLISIVGVIVNIAIVGSFLFIRTRKDQPKTGTSAARPIPPVATPSTLVVPADTTLSIQTPVTSPVESPGIPPTQPTVSSQADTPPIS